MFPLKTNIPVNKVSYGLWGLIIINFIIYIFFRFHYYGLLFADYGFMPLKLSMPPELVGLDEKIIPFFSYMFLHSSFVHVFINMYFLYVFGKNIEDKVGTVLFLCLYIFFGVTAVIFEAFLDPDLSYPIVGSSGAVTAVMGLFLVFFPDAKIKTFIFLFIYGIVRYIPVIVIVILFFISQLLIWYAEQIFDLNDYLYILQNYIGIKNNYINISNIAYYTHAGGFLIGMITGLIIRIKNK